uniref:Ligand-binding protein SH3 n=1 Tax=uncultured Thiotrichaceae bacterium TaxID=298394 RepID=A0A6S6T9S8_9GAMM|nr:MAG: Unknown protein [uncultured Thiotrichaceae bacterium]
MFSPIEVPFGCSMLFNVVDLKEGVTVDDVELLLGEMCNVVKNNYGDDNGGFIGGQVYRNAGFISDEGSVQEDDGNVKKRVQQNMGDIVIVTYWQSFEQHEKSHADKLFKEKFDKLAEFCDDTYEVGYEMLWQGVPEEE